MAESKKQIMLTKGREYVALIRKDRGAYPPEIKAMAEYVGVSRRLFYKADPEIQKIVSTVEALRIEAEAKSALELVSEGSDLGSISYDELAEESERIIRRVTWAMQRFIGQRSTGTGALDEIALVVYDLDTCVSQIGSARRDLGGIAEEVGRRAGAMHPVREDSEGPELLLDLHPEDG